MGPKSWNGYRFRYDYNWDCNTSYGESYRTIHGRKVLSKYHADNHLHSPIVRLQMSEIDEYVLLDGSDKRWWDYRDLVSSRNARYRSFMVLTMAIFGQWYVSSYRLQFGWLLICFVR